MTETKKNVNRPERLPLLAVRDVVMFPHMVLPLSVGRPKSVKAIEASMAQHSKMLMVVAQKEVAVEDPKAEDIYRAVQAPRNRRATPTAATTISPTLPAGSL
jgi:ATP-dependent Lon protease